MASDGHNFVSAQELKEVKFGWDCEFKRGPEWLIVRPLYQAPPSHSNAHLDTQLIRIVWEALTQHFVYRLIIEIDQLESFPPNIVDQLIELRERLEEHDGMLHFSGCNELLEDELEKRNFHPHIFPCPEQALMGTTFRYPK